MKMINCYSLVSFMVLLEIAKTYGILNLDLTSMENSCRNQLKPRDVLHAFNDVGFVRIEAFGRSNIIKEERMYIEVTYNNTDWNSTPIIKFNIGSPNSFDLLYNLINTNKPSEEKPSYPYEYESTDSLDAVTMLSLERSRLHNLSSDTFQWLEDGNLEFLNMRNTQITGVAPDTLQPVQSSLKSLDLANSSISVEDLVALMEGLYNDSIEAGSNLKVLSLANLNLKSIPYDALRPVQYSLIALSFFGNDFHTLSEGAIASLEETAKLSRTLDTSDDYEDTEIPSDDDYTDESDAIYLQELSETMNSSAGSAWSNFPLMPFLIELDLRQCRIDSIEQGTFANLGNLKRLYISRNNVLVLPAFAFDGLRSLEMLDLSFNRCVPNVRESIGLTLEDNSFGGLYSLTAIELRNSYIRHRTANFLSGLPSTLTLLNLCGTSLLVLEDGIFENLNNLQILDLSFNFGMGSDLTTETFKGLDMLHALYLDRTALEDLEAVKELSLLKLLDVKRNNIVNLSGVLQNLPLLESLDVTGNYINSWHDGRAFEKNPKLTEVFLQSNSLSLMTNDMVEDFKSLKRLTLANNNFVCNCELKQFFTYLLTINNDTTVGLPILADYTPNGTSHTCTDVSMSRSIRFVDTDEYCLNEWTKYWLTALQHGIYISMIVTIVTIGIGALIYWKWWYIRYVAVLLKNATVLSMINVENCEDRIYTYDIFVSFSDENRNWVIEELLPNIEGPDARFSICLHERDFQVGVSILENIIMGMDQSRTILLIISGFFIKSQWCQFEMHMAQHRLLETCREELVLVLLEEIPRRKRPKTLHYLMMVKTYIVWPKNSEDNNAKKLFWKRLRKAITANKYKKVSVV